MASRGFRWEAPPTRLVASLGKYDAAVTKGAHQVGDVYAAKMEAYAKSTAPWADRTGNARKGLAGTTEKSATVMKIWLYGDATYLQFLELGTRTMRPYPVIWPTISAHVKPLMDDLRRLVEG